MVGMLRFGMPMPPPDGESHFDEVELPTTKRSVPPDAVPFEVSASYQACRVRLIPAGILSSACFRKTVSSVLLVDRHS
jgi:hypothetical protein